MNAPRLASVALCATALTLSPSLVHADHDNLEDGLPLVVTDAYSLPLWGREIQGLVRYEHTPDGRNLMFYEPRIEVGFPRNAQFALLVPVQHEFSTSQAAESVELGRARLDFQYNLNQETLVVPALTLGGGARAPSTEDPDESVDPFLRFAVTKAIPGIMLPFRLHVNGTLHFNVNRRPAEEREFGYLLALGADMRIGATVTGLADVVREERLMGEAPPSTFGEIGVRVQMTPLLVFSAGGGAGATDEGDPVGRATVAFQYVPF